MVKTVNISSAYHLEHCSCGYQGVWKIQTKFWPFSRSAGSIWRPDESNESALMYLSWSS